MSLDVDPPEPPSLRRGAVTDDDLPESDGRRDTLAEALAEGAWADGFEEWAADTHLTVEEFSHAVEHDIVDGIDLYWDAETESVGYAVSPLPEGLREAMDRGDVEEVRAAIDDLADTVAATLATEYLPREEGVFEFSSGDTDPEFRDTE